MTGIGNVWDDITARTEAEAIEKACKCFDKGKEEIVSITKSVYNFNKKVVDIYGNEMLIDENHRKIHSFSNKNKLIVYNAASINLDDTEESIYTNYLIYADYKEQGVVEDVRKRMEQWNNPITLAYACVIDFNATKNDPDRKIWEKFVKYVEAHQDEFFTKAGDWKQRVAASTKKRMEIYITDNK